MGIQSIKSITKLTLIVTVINNNVFFKKLSNFFDQIKWPFEGKFFASFSAKIWGNVNQDSDNLPMY